MVLKLPKLVFCFASELFEGPHTRFSAGCTMPRFGNARHFGSLKIPPFKPSSALMMTSGTVTSSGVIFFCLEASGSLMF